MLSKSQPLIEAVTEPLAGNAEQRMAANAVLEATIDSDHPGVADAAARLEAAGRRRFPALRTTLPWVFAALALAMTVSSKLPTFRMAEMIYRFDIFEQWEKPAHPASLTEEERLLLGGPDLDDLEGSRRLHLHAPENPAYFAEYVENFGSERDALPPDFLETAARIAPDNAFFIYYAAGRVAKDSVSRKSRSGPAPPPRYVDGVRLLALPREAEFDITDPAGFNEALELVEKAAALPEFATYMNPMAAARVGLLSPDTLAEFMVALTHAYGRSTGMFQFRHVSDLLSARAAQLSKSGSEEEFVALAAQRDALIAHLGRNPDTNLIGELLCMVIAAGTATDFHFAAERLGLVEMAEAYRKQSDEFQELRDLREIRHSNEGDPFPVERASAWTRMSIPMVARQASSPPPIDIDDFKPMRMAEHELLGGLGILAVALIIPLAALAVFLFPFAVPPMMRLPAKRMAGVLNVLDWVWVTGLGVVLPIFLFLIVTRLSPLGGWGYGASHFLFMLPGIHVVALLLGLLIAPALVVRWRIVKRLAPLGLKNRFTVPISLAALALLILWSLAALPVLVFLGTGKLILIALAAPPVICLILLFANALRSLRGGPATRLAQATTALAVLPAYAVAIVILCALTPIYSAGEIRWLAKETLLRIDPAAADLGAYEYKVAAQMRKEINAIMGAE